MTTTPTGRMILALNTLCKHVYAGTVSPKVIARRRAANKIARRSRRINRAGAR